MTADTLTCDNFKVVDSLPEGADLIAQISYAFEAAPHGKHSGKATLDGKMWVAKATGTYTITFAARFVKAEVLKCHKCEDVLSHERLHLRLAEYVAAKGNENVGGAFVLTGEARDMDQKTAMKKADKLIESELVKRRGAARNKVEAMDVKVQERYDRDTKGGALPAPQKEWEEKWKEKANAILKANGWSK